MVTPTNQLANRPIDQLTNRANICSAICLFEVWKIEGRDLQLEVADQKYQHGKERSYSKNKNTSETSEPRSITWEYAK